MLNLLNDKETYSMIKNNPNLSIQNKINKLITKWKANQMIDENMAKIMTTYNGVTPRIYGIPKLHKIGIPLRPIVSNITAPTYKLSKMLNDIISKVVNQNNLSIKDMWTFHKYNKYKNNTT